MVKYHRQLIQGSEEWLQARCGLLTASEMKLIVTTEGGGTVTKYHATGAAPKRMTPKREQALQSIGSRSGTMRELAFAADVSEGVLRDLAKEGVLEAEQVEVPLSFKAASDDKERSHMWELLAQRITGYVEPSYVSDDMLRGQEDELEACILYGKHFARVDAVGFITNDRFGFTLGYSPDGLIGDDGLIECKSRRQKYQVETIVNGEVPADYMIQLQTGLLVSERKWIDFISYSGGLPMFVKRVEPDPEIQDAIVAAASAFEAKLAEKRALFERAAPDLIPTERKEYEELVI